MEAKKEQHGVESEEGHKPANEKQPKPHLQQVGESEGERSAEEEALIDQWLAERQCSGL